jgi:type I restriction enzyme S subunit
VSFPRYPKYKDSGVEWLGEVPEHWDLKPLWTRFRRVKRTGYEGEELLSVYRDHGVVPKSSRSDNFNNASDDLSTYQLVVPGDLAINKMKAWQGSVAVSGHRGIVSPAYFVYESLHGDSDRYLHYLMRSLRYIPAYLSISKGIRINQWDLDPQLHSRLPLTIPPLAEQHAIASFLDRETAKIEELVAEQQRLMELLKEKRKAVISHAVTKGLNPDAPMKPSGVEWLGEVPVHWEVLRLRYGLEESKAGPFGSALTKDMYVDAGYRVYGQEQVIPGDFTIGDYFITPAKYEELAQYRVAPSDILVSCVGTFGKIALVPEGIAPGIINPRLIRLRCTNRLIPTFLVEALRSDVTFEQFTAMTRGGTMDVINIGTLREIAVAVPPTEEQHLIVSFLRQKLDEFDSLVEQAMQVIALLEERRSALISAAVTGQIDLRTLSQETAA